MVDESFSAYPRPDFIRTDLQLLQGEWGFEFDPDCRGLSGNWHKKGSFSRTIRVPFCVESDASGICCENPPPVFWYAKAFVPQIPFEDGRALLCFGAVDYRADVWLNGEYLGFHEGGYTPFRFEIQNLRSDENFLVVRVEDYRDPRLPRGKQTVLSKPFLVFYPSVSGIWQPVWLERAGAAYVKDLKVFTDLASRSVRIRALLAGEEGEYPLKVRVQSPSGETIEEKIRASKGKADGVIESEIAIPSPQLWSPEAPNLYDLEITIGSKNGDECLRSYFGFREIKTEDGEVFLNGQPLYQRLVLCQGYFEKGHYTPIDPLQYRRDVELARKMGFNGVRMHQKIEDPRFLFWCDFLGCLLWEEMPSAFLYSRKMRRALETEWHEVIKRDFNHPSIIVRVPLNESWGVGTFLFPVNIRDETRRYVTRFCRLTKDADPTRLVIDNSGYEHTSCTDILDVHHYLASIERCERLYAELESLSSFNYSLKRLIKAVNPAVSNQNLLLPGEKYAGQPIIISEYGGFGYYRAGRGSPLEDFEEYTRLIKSKPHIKGYCYTQLYDTYQEKNGLLEISRRAKFPVEKIRSINER